MDFRIPETVDYPNILKYLVEGGLDYITDLNMDQIRILCLDTYYYHANKNRLRRDFTIYEGENMILSHEDHIRLIKDRYGYIKESTAIKRLRIIYLDEVMKQVLEVFKALRISYRRQGRLEATEKALQGLGMKLQQESYESALKQELNNK